MEKLKDILNESVLGKLPSESMFKYNHETGKYESPKKRNGVTEDIVKESISQKEAYEIVSLANLGLKSSNPKSKAWETFNAIKQLVSKG